jgi:hypothetical protein
MTDLRSQNGNAPQADELQRAYEGLRILAARIAGCDRTDFSRMMELQIKYAALDGFARGLEGAA